MWSLLRLVKLLIPIKQVMMVLHRLHMLNFALLKIGVPLIPTSHSHHHLVVCTHHIILPVVIWVMILLLITVFIAHMILLHFMMILLPEVLLLLMHRLRYNPLGVKVHG
jgi:hypothetical protein